MPDTYQVNQKFNPLPEPSPDREQFGLPRDLFVFAAFNNNYKITPIWFDVWMRILRRVPNSVLWVLEDNEWVKNNLLNETRRRGVDAHRIHFAPRLPREQHLQRQRCADLFLDTFPYNAHTTASDALRYGLPLLTCRGEGFASRVAYSLLCAVGLPELATDSAQGYENMAVDLASNDEKLKAIKMKLSDALMNSKLFDTQNFVQNFELALKDLHSKKSTLAPMTHWTSTVVSH
jgi:predicted O-linked N-acetylglucosamine transferase (SPINDLY family)